MYLNFVYKKEDEDFLSEKLFKKIFQYKKSSFLKNMTNKKFDYKLKDIYDKNTEIVFCGMAPGKKSCKWNHYYANPGNRFWGILKEIGFLDSLIEPTKNPFIRIKNYNKLKKKHIGLTDLIKNQCGMDKIIKVELSDIYRLREFIDKNIFKVLVFNGKKPAEKFLNINSRKIKFGKQKDSNYKIKIWVLPSTSGANTGWRKNNYFSYWKNFKNSL